MTNYLDIERLASLTRSKRGKRGLKEVAREAGISSPSAIFRVEEGKIPNMATFQALCVWLNMPPADLVENYSPGEKLLGETHAVGERSETCRQTETAPFGKASPTARFHPLHSREREQTTFAVKSFETATRLTGEEMSELLGIDPEVRRSSLGTELAIRVLNGLRERGLSGQWYWCKYEQIYLKRSEYLIDVLERRDP
jgi:transcriptional regulator with XRE-family HTH domain